MNFNIPYSLKEKIVEDPNISDRCKELFRDSWRFSSNNDSISLDSDKIEQSDIKLVSEMVNEMSDDIKYVKGAKKQFSVYENILKNPAGAKVGKLESLKEALKQYIQGSPNKWLFREDRDGNMTPYFVKDIEYHPYDPRNQSPAYVRVSLKYVIYFEERSTAISYHSEDIRGRNILELLRKDGYVLENDSFVEDYYAELEVYNHIRTQTGNQFNVYGSGDLDTDSWRNPKIYLERDGKPAKCVMDNESLKEDRRSSTNAHIATLGFWNLSDKEAVAYLPIHPYVRMFHLNEHTFFRVHINNIKPYVWQPELGEKLVLNEDRKTLINILVEGTKYNIDDIIEGKTGGIFVLATGHPGTGKTLTAEVFSEVIKKPLYVVQCSQLGINVEEVEKKLKVILLRAQRWGAILLIDEADVYVRKRGTDIQQNAIVGVFLRTLEYYSGVIFMTSNMGTDIDDAILSRATAHIKYEKPSTSEREKIWTILLEQAGMVNKVKSTEISEFAKYFDSATGRDIKNMIKLARLLHINDKREFNLSLLTYVSNFVDIQK